MKKITMICMSALLLLAVSCKKDKNTENDNTGRGLRVAAEAHAGDSKTHLDGVAVKWDLDDKILVMDLVGGEMHNFSPKSADGIAFFEPAAGEDVPDEFYSGSYLAFYPSDCCEDLEYVSLPDIQTYAEGTFALNANPMIGASKDFIESDFGGDGDAPVCEDADITFFNFCGLLKLQLYAESDCTVKSIALTTNKEGEMLWGKGVISVEDYDEGSLIEIEEEDGEIHLLDGGNTLTLDCGTTGVSLSVGEGNPTVFYFVVPPLALTEGFTVKVTDTDGNVWTKTTTKNNQIYRSKVTVMPVTEVGAMHEPIVPESVTLEAGCVECTYTITGSVTVPESTACEFGFVYSDSDETPTIEEGANKIIVHAMNESAISGTQNFTVDLTAFTSKATYHVCAYAMIEGVIYSTGIEIGDLPHSLPSNWVNGTNPFPFSVSATRQVYFSQGNLQYLAKGGSAGDAIAEAEDGNSVGGTWRFAEHQFDIIGAGNANLSNNYEGWIDLFGWGTSGYKHTTVYQPWGTSTSDMGFWAYTVITQDASFNYHLFSQTPAIADWGYNVISNGGSGWRTLTHGAYWGLNPGQPGEYVDGEWEYLISRRDSEGNLLCGQGRIGRCMPGLILLPDNWKWEGNVEKYKEDWTPGESDWANVYSYSEWADMEAKGAVFLPAAGWRNNKTVSKVGEMGRYWLSTQCGNKQSNAINFLSNDYSSNDNASRRCGFSVRLVKDAN